MKLSAANPPIPGFRLAAAPLALALLAGGCASVPAGPKAGTEAAVSGVEALTGASRSYPKFSDIPNLPVDERPLAAWGEAAAEVIAEGEALARGGTEETWTLRGTEAFAAGALAASGPAAPTVSATASADAFAREVRKRATPPPPPVR
ncbi:MAG: hypothetical protein RL588_2040 [Pseudomonadota bacterium]|jgi:hypothetical protein